MTTNRITRPVAPSGTHASLVPLSMDHLAGLQGAVHGGAAAQPQLQREIVALVCAVLAAPR